MNMIPSTYIAWHCKKCGHSKEIDRVAYSYPVNCPSCGAPEVRHGHPRLPVNSVDADSQPQNYDLCSSKKSIQVYLRSLDGSAHGMTFDPDDVPDTSDDPISVAEEVLSMAEKYFYYGGLDKLRGVVDSMKSNKELSDKNWIENRKHEIRAEMVALRQEWEGFE
jgi:hypothetical protein